VYAGIAVACLAWGILILLAVLWLKNAGEAGERFDQVMADHYADHCPDEIDP
jgi:hypothetical protein